MDRIDIASIQFTNFGYRTFSKEDCYGLLTFYKASCRDAKWIDESTPNALYVVFHCEQKYALNSLRELQLLTSEIERLATH